VQQVLKHYALDARGCKLVQLLRRIALARPTGESDTVAPAPATPIVAHLYERLAAQLPLLHLSRSSTTVRLGRERSV
jgi:hypothetical protein